MLSIFVMAFSPISSFVCGQDSSDTNKDADKAAVSESDELPEHAIWRYGKAGKGRGFNGYYRIAFSPNGNYCVFRNRANLVSLVDMKSREVLFEFTGYEDRESVLNFDFSPDSKYFLTSAQGSDEKISIWDVETGKLYRELESDGKVAFFENAKTVGVLKSGEVVSFSLETGEKTGTQKWGSDGDLPVTMTRNKDIVVSQRKFGQTAYKTHVYNVVEQNNTILNSPSSFARTVVTSEDGNWLAATYTREKEVRVWDLRKPHKSIRKLSAHVDNAQSVCFSSDNRFIATTGWDSEVYLWDVLTGQKIGQLSGHTEHVNSCAFSPEGYVLATGAAGMTDNTIIFWDYRDLVFPKVEGAPDEIDFPRLWSHLSSANLRRGLDAVSRLAENADDKLLTSFADKLGIEVVGISTEQIKNWIVQLSDRRFKVRVNAEERLRRARMRAEDLLNKELDREDLIAEVRYRILRILKQPVERPKIEFSELRRLHRIVFALELVESELSQQILQNLADSHPHIDVARDAADSLRRVKARLASNENN